MPFNKPASLKTLNALYDSFDFRERARRDPIKFPKCYKKQGDIEAAAFIASALSYGRVELFMPVIERILSVMGRSPHAFLLEFNAKKYGRLFDGISYRFQSTYDILCLLDILGHVFRKYKSLERLFMRHVSGRSPDIGNALACMVDEMLSSHRMNTSGRTTSHHNSRGLIHMLPSPINGSACKRLNLFLRWVVRDKDIDVGIWKGVPKNNLVIPLDTHIMAVSKRFGLTEKKTPSWRAALEITSALKTVEPEDPLKFDFPLCHAEMVKFRKGETSSQLL